MAEPAPSAAPPETAAPKNPAGFARVARLIGRRTTDLLAISILAVGALMVGGRLSEWWSTKPEDVAHPAEIAAQEAGTIGGWGGGENPITLEFGGSSQSIRRQTIAGSQDQLFTVLNDWCRETLRHSDLPKANATAAESRLLARLAGTTPAGESGDERIYLLKAPLRMIVGVRELPAATAPEAEIGKSEADARRARVVCWGFAFPVKEGAWTAFLASPGGRAAAGTSLPDIPIPSGSRRHLSMRDDSGDGIVSFSGAGEPALWRQGFDQWFETHGWKTVSRWSELDGSWAARFASPSAEPKSGWQGAVDVQISFDSNGALAGLLNFLPRNEPDNN